MGLTYVLLLPVAWLAFWVAPLLSPSWTHNPLCLVEAATAQNCWMRMATLQAHLAMLAGLVATVVIVEL